MKVTKSDEGNPWWGLRPKIYFVVAPGLISIRRLIFYKASGLIWILIGASSLISAIKGYFGNLTFAMTLNFKLRSRNPIKAIFIEASDQKCTLWHPASFPAENWIFCNLTFNLTVTFKWRSQNRWCQSWSILNEASGLKYAFVVASVLIFARKLTNLLIRHLLWPWPSEEGQENRSLIRPLA